MKLLLLALFACACSLASASDIDNFYQNPNFNDENGELGKGCCLPTQWEGRVGVFYMRSRLLRPVFRISDSKVGFDFKNKKVAARSMMYCRKTKKIYRARSIADFKAKKVYFIYKNKCKVHSLKAQLKKPCIPSNFKRFGSYSYGAGKTKLNLAPFGLRNKRLEYFLAVTQGTCVPIKGAFRTRKGRRTKTYGKYQYYNITTGNKDRSLYTVPDSCNSAEVDDQGPGMLLRFRSYFRPNQHMDTEMPFGEDSELSAAGEEAMAQVAKLVNGNAAVAQNANSGRWLRNKWQRLRNKFDRLRRD